MSDEKDKARRRGAQPLSALVGRVLDPVAARRGFATADLVTAWPDIVGPAYADCTAPEKIAWPRKKADADGKGVLVLRVDGPKAIYLQHEIEAIAERVNRFLGFAAIERIRIVQGPVEARGPRPAAGTPKLAQADEESLAAGLAMVDDDALRAALARLGRHVLGEGADRPHIDGANKGHN